MFDLGCHVKSKKKTRAGQMPVMKSLFDTVYFNEWNVHVYVYLHFLFGIIVYKWLIHFVLFLMRSTSQQTKNEQIKAACSQTQLELR